MEKLNLLSIGVGILTGESLSETFWLAFSSSEARHSKIYSNSANMPGYLNSETLLLRWKK